MVTIIVHVRSLPPSGFVRAFFYQGCRAWAAGKTGVLRLLRAAPSKLIPKNQNEGGKNIQGV